MKFFEHFFENVLWNSRFVVMLAVVSSLVAGFAVFFMATVDVYYLVMHLVGYADPGLAQSARKTLNVETVSHIIGVVDGFLLATVMLIFSLGLYELFISDIDPARGSKASSRVLVIHDLDDLKNRLAKVIVMMLFVGFFERAMKVQIAGASDLLYAGGSIAMIGLALFLMHKAESHPQPKE
jgi:uncharacterized membrane protein YqhA